MSVSTGGEARRGPRPAGEDVRERILTAARREFGAGSFQSTTIRQIAEAAGVDAKLVHYYFGSKAELFTTAIAEAFQATGVLQRLLENPPSQGSAGTAYLRVILEQLEESDSSPQFIGLLRNLGTHEQSRQIFLDFVSTQIIATVAPRLGGADALTRLTLAGSQMLGLVTARYIAGIPVISELPRDEIAALVGPTIDRYLFGELPGT